VKRFSDRHQLSTLSELNITPLLDLAFVLLIIFMITTPLIETSSDLVIPTGRGTPNATPLSEAEIISINRDALIELNGTPVTPGGLAAALKALGKPNAAVGIRAHRDLPVQRLVEVMGELKAAGITRIGLVNAEEPAPQAP